MSHFFLLRMVQAFLLAMNLWVVYQGSQTDHNAWRIIGITVLLAAMLGLAIALFTKRW